MSMNGWQHFAKHKDCGPAYDSSRVTEGALPESYAEFCETFDEEIEEFNDEHNTDFKPALSGEEIANFITYLMKDYDPYEVGCAAAQYVIDNEYNPDHD